MADVLRLSKIEKAYHRGAANQIDVLSGLDFTLPEGEIVALVAPSGAGKSTLLHIAGLLDVPDDGEVEIAGQTTQGLGDAGRTRLRRETVGFVYQFHHLLPEFTAAENVALPQLANAVPQAEATARADQLLGSLGVGDRAGHRPATLSGGEQQRVAIARALANRPGLLLADEPTGNLDVANSDLVFEALLSLARTEGLSALIATHNPSLAARMDRVVRLEGGRLAQG